jgi:cytochrome c peroxidase
MHNRRWLVVVLAVVVYHPYGYAQSVILPLPLGLQEQTLIIPEHNPLTAEKIALGKQIFFDSRWSKNQTVSCATCHSPQHGWSDPRPLSIDHDGKPTRRHAPTIINRAFSRVEGWAGHRESSEELLLKLAFSSPETIAQHLRPVKGYREQFQRVFGTEVTAVGAAQAIAAYQRTILSGNSPYDRFKAGDKDALSPAAQRGLTLFDGKARCVLCHHGANFTDEGYHNLGVGMDKDDPDLGRYEVTKKDTNKGAFKTPTLRDGALRGPYMHNGSLQTLQAVVEFYNRGGFPNPWLSPEIEPLSLTTEEQADLVTFLVALTGAVLPDVSSLPVLP